jgi:YD repeat-containing protein
MSLTRQRMVAVMVAVVAASLAPTSWSQVTTSYTYDTRGRIKTVVRPANTVAYTYDAADNRVALGVTNPASPTPSVGSVSANTPYNTAVAIALAPSGVYSSLALASGPVHGTASIAGTTATYIPVAGFSGSDSFTYVAIGPGGQSAPATVSITVYPGSGGSTPVLQPDEAQVAPQGIVFISPLDNDSDPNGYPLTLTSVVADIGAATIVGSQVRYVAPSVPHGGSRTAVLTYAVSNGHGGTASSTITVYVGDDPLGGL